MIKWYSGKDKIPNIGDKVIVYTKFNNMPFLKHEETLYDYIVLRVDEFNHPVWDEVGVNVYWAYASEFNFPSEVRP